MDNTGYMIRVVRIVILTAFVLSIGMTGYSTIEGWGWLDSLYMAIITLTTVGFGEIRPLSPEGRLFTIFYIFLGAGFVLYMFTAVTEAIVSGQIESFMGRKRMEKRIADLNDHCIIAGFGRIGRSITQILGADYPLIIIEKHKEMEEFLKETRQPYILGDATNDSILEKSGLNRARALVAALPTDADNVYITRTAKELNPDIMVVTRADHEGGRRRLTRAGADHVISPYLIGARRMALILAKPTVTDFLEESLFAGSIDRLLELEEIKIEGASTLDGQDLIEANLSERCNIILLSVKKATGEVIFNPHYMQEINSGDTLVVLGESDALKCLRDLAAPRSLT